LPWQAEKQSPSQQGGTCPLSEIRVTTISNTAGTGPVTLTKQHAAKAWSSLDASGGSTTTQHGSFNISSVLDDGAGQYGFNFSSNMSGATFSSVGSANSASGYNLVTNWTGVPDAYTAGRTGIGVLRVDSGNNSYIDSDVCIAVFGDLA